MRVAPSDPGGELATNQGLSVNAVASTGVASPVADQVVLAPAATALTHSQITGWRTQSVVERLAREHDLVVIDSPPHAETEARIAVRAASLVIVPIQPSPMDLWATQPTIDLARQEKVPVLLVLNRVPPHTKVSAAIIAQVTALGQPPAVRLAQGRIGNRAAYAGALYEGRSVTESARPSDAGREIAALAAEILATPA